MHVIVYRWRLKPGREVQFAEAWEAVTRHYLALGSGGSAFFTAEDGTYVAIARWPDVATFEAASQSPAPAALGAQMADAVEERLPVLRLEGLTDLWTLPSGGESGL